MKGFWSKRTVGPTGWRRPGIHWFGAGAGQEGLKRAAGQRESEFYLFKNSGF